jgi:hypothetical protein
MLTAREFYEDITKERFWDAKEIVYFLSKHSKGKNFTCMSVNFDPHKIAGDATCIGRSSLYRRLNSSGYEDDLSDAERKLLGEINLIGKEQLENFPKRNLDGDELERNSMFVNLLQPLRMTVLPFYARTPFYNNQETKILMYGSQCILHELICSNKLDGDIHDGIDDIRLTALPFRYNKFNKRRDLVALAIAHYRLGMQPGNYTIKTLTHDPMMEHFGICKTFQIGGELRALQNLIKVIFPAEFVRRGNPKRLKPISTQPRPLEIPDIFIKTSNGDEVINFQALRIVVRTVFWCFFHESYNEIVELNSTIKMILSVFTMVQIFEKLNETEKLLLQHELEGLVYPILNHKNNMKFLNDLGLFNVENR